MSILTLPTQAEFEGPKALKPGMPAIPDADKTYGMRVAAQQALLNRQIEATTELGLSDGSTLGSVRRAVMTADIRCRLATTANDSLSGLAARDGVTPVDGDWVLVMGQAAAQNNGVYIAHGGAWTRANVDLHPGTIFSISEGTEHLRSLWNLATTGPITVGVTLLYFAKVFGLAGTIDYTGAALKTTGQVSGVAFNGQSLAITGASATINGTYSLYRCQHAAALTALTLDATNWPINATRRITKENASTFAITLAPPSGGNIQGGATDAVITLPGSGQATYVQRADAWWEITRITSTAWRVTAGGAVRFFDASGVVLDGAFNAVQLQTSGNGSAGSPAVQVGAAGRGLYGDATKGVVAAVGGVDQLEVRADRTVRVRRQNDTTDGGELRLELPASGSTLGGDVAIDVVGNMLRIFENGGSSRGATFDLSACAGSAGSKLSPSESGTYTPTGFVTTNLDSVTPQLGFYQRIKTGSAEIVIVHGSVTVDPTASGQIQFDLSLPVASNLVGTYDLHGTAIAGVSFIGGVIANTASDRAAFTMGNTLTIAYDLRYSFAYRVL